MVRALHVDADLRVGHESGALRVRGSGSQLRIDLDRLATLLALRAPRPGGEGPAGRDSLARLLGSAGISVRIHWRDRAIATIDSKGPGPILARLGVGPGTLHPWSLLRALVSRPRPAPDGTRVR